MAVAGVTSLTPDEIEGLGSSLRGRLITPSEPDYDEARKVHNGMIDRRPAAIAMCLDVADVMAACEADAS